MPDREILPRTDPQWMGPISAALRLMAALQQGLPDGFIGHAEIEVSKSGIQRARIVASFEKEPRP